MILLAYHFKEQAELKESKAEDYFLECVRN